MYDKGLLPIRKNKRTAGNWKSVRTIHKKKNEIQKVL